MVVVLLHHHSDRHVDMSSSISGTDCWKKNLLFFGEVLSDLRFHPLQQGSQSMGTTFLFRMDAFDSPGSIEQCRKIQPQRLVVASEDEVDEFRQRSGVPTGSGL